MIRILGDGTASRVGNVSIFKVLVTFSYQKKSTFYSLITDFGNFECLVIM